LAAAMSGLLAIKRYRIIALHKDDTLALHKKTVRSSRPWQKYWWKKQNHSIMPPHA